jgi:hypothetical protein
VLHRIEQATADRAVVGVRNGMNQDVHEVAGQGLRPAGGRALHLSGSEELLAGGDGVQDLLVRGLGLRLLL